MSGSTTIKDIKKAQKERLLLREISQLFTKASIDDSRLNGIFVNRVALSPDKGLCYVYFYTAAGKSAFDEKLEILKLYKPSLRSALAKAISSRYMPDLLFKFDDIYEKEAKINELLDQLKVEGEL